MALKLEYVYLLNVYPGTEVPVYKYGQTMRHFPERFKDYKNAKPTIILVLSCEFCKNLEKTTLKKIKEEFNMRPDLGREYFEGDLAKIKRVVINEYRTHVKAYSNNAPVDADATDGTVSIVDTIEHIINGHEHAELNESLANSLRASEIIDIAELVDLAVTSKNRRFLRFLHDNNFDIFGPKYELYFRMNDDIKSFYDLMLPRTITLDDSKIIAKALGDKYMATRLCQETIKTYLVACIDDIDYDLFKEYISLYHGPTQDLVNCMQSCDVDHFFDKRTLVSRSVEPIDESLDSMIETIGEYRYRKRSTVKSFLVKILQKIRGQQY